MSYRSTRDCNKEPAKLSFKEVVFAGLAPDGGLFVPEKLPLLTNADLAKWRNLSFQEICLELFPKFIGNDIPSEALKDLVYKSFATFRNDEVTPVKPLGDKEDNLYLLELFHGPTFAFKDVALQFLGNVFEFFLRGSEETEQKSRRLTVVGATSGDTGGAAIYGLRGKPNIDVYILHPKDRISVVQEAQMTSVLDSNVHNVAISGTFDDCQNMVKDLFRDEEFRKHYSLGAVNSINWARILAQMAYYFYAFFRFPEGSKVRFSVPTGNFGDVLAGFYAKKLGLPIDQLLVATNENDILHRFFETGVYAKTEAIATFSPAMDIQISSNFERFLWHSLNEIFSEDRTAASVIVSRWMVALQKNGRFDVSDLPDEYRNKADLHTIIRSYFKSSRASDEDILRVIKEFSKKKDFHDIIDPHTACGIHAAKQIQTQDSVITVCLATAHPIKFVSSVIRALEGSAQDVTELERQILAGEKPSPFTIPVEFQNILTRPKRCIEAKAGVEHLKNLIRQRENK
ncbi:hypothetical protein MP638_006564 [Amoeboaphelidium occidentale]|nr:hypothetical protein MP638_006564 [Amoeboaphelidium occidentale]